MLLLLLIVTAVGGHNQESPAEPLRLTERHAGADTFETGKPVNPLGDCSRSRLRQRQRAFLQFRPAQLFQSRAEIGKIKVGDVPFHRRYLFIR